MPLRWHPTGQSAERWSSTASTKLQNILESWAPLVSRHRGGP